MKMCCKLNIKWYNNVFFIIMKILAVIMKKMKQNIYFFLVYFITHPFLMVAKKDDKQ